MSRAKDNSKDWALCPFYPDNTGLRCESQTKCLTCGWSPEVDRERRRRLKAGLPALEKQESKCVSATDLYDEDGGEIVEVPSE